jgi:hypothetical protein
MHKIALVQINTALRPCLWVCKVCQRACMFMLATNNLPGTNNNVQLSCKSYAEFEVQVHVSDITQFTIETSNARQLAYYYKLSYSIYSN